MFELPEKNQKDLVSDRQLVKLLHGLGLTEQVWVAVLALSGRRQCDISKITKEAVCTNDIKTFVLLPKDKTHQNSLVSFEFTWKWDLELDLTPLKTHFEFLLNSCTYPFAGINVQSVRRKCDFRLHAGERMTFSLFPTREAKNVIFVIFLDILV